MSVCGLWHFWVSAQGGARRGRGKRRLGITAVILPLCIFIRFLYIALALGGRGWLGVRSFGAFAPRRWARFGTAGVGAAIARASQPCRKRHRLGAPRSGITPARAPLHCPPPRAHAPSLRPPTQPRLMCMWLADVASADAASANAPSADALSADVVSADAPSADARETYLRGVK